MDGPSLPNGLDCVLDIPPLWQADWTRNDVSDTDRDTFAGTFAGRPHLLLSSQVVVLLLTADPLLL